jgi:hypothetical protein
MAAWVEYLKRRREDSGRQVRLVRETGDSPTPSGRRNSMSEELKKDQPEDETEDVEAHSPVQASPVQARPVQARADEPASDEGSDDVEAHISAARPKQARPKQA